MAEMLLDATVFRDYRVGDPGARAIIEQVIEGSRTASISPLTVFELWGGLPMDRRTEMGYAGMLGFLEAAPLSPEAAKVAGVWIASVEPEQRDELARVALIAATAQERGEPVYTRNVEPFSKFYSDVVGY
mgnify:CR=1 FL=1